MGGRLDWKENVSTLYTAFKALSAVLPAQGKHAEKLARVCGTVGEEEIAFSLLFSRLQGGGASRLPRWQCRQLDGGARNKHS